MKFASVKHALGWYVARRKGPAQVKAFDPSDKATKTPYVDNQLVYITIAQLLHNRPPEGLGLHRRDPRRATLLDWASKSDDAGIEPDQGLVTDLAGLLEDAGLLERVVPPTGAYVEFVDLNTGQVMKTWREKKA